MVEQGHNIWWPLTSVHYCHGGPHNYPGDGRQRKAKQICATTKPADPFDGSLFTGHPMRKSKCVWCHCRNKIGTCSSCSENDSSIPVKYFFSTEIFQYGFKVIYSLGSTCIASGKVQLHWPGEHSGMPSWSVVTVPWSNIAWEQKPGCHRHLGSLPYFSIIFLIQRNIWLKDIPLCSS